MHPAQWVTMWHAVQCYIWLLCLFRNQHRVSLLEGWTMAFEEVCVHVYTCALHADYSIVPRSFRTSSRLHQLDKQRNYVEKKNINWFWHWPSDISNMHAPSLSSQTVSHLFLEGERRSGYTTQLNPNWVPQTSMNLWQGSVDKTLWLSLGTLPSSAHTWDGLRVLARPLAFAPFG